MRIAGLLPMLLLSATLAAQTSGLLNLPPSKDPGAQKGGQLLEQMVAALGGQAYLNLQDMQQQGRTYSFYHGEAQGVGALYWRFWKWPDKERIELTKQRDWYYVYTGNKGYEVTYKGSTDVEQELLDDYLRRRSHSLQWVLRNWLKEPGVILLYEGKALAERKQADKVTLLNRNNDAVTISIDSNTHLPLQTSFVFRDPQTRDRDEIAEGYDNYRPIQGIMTPFSITRYKNGEPVNQRFINGTTYNQGLADSMFSASAPPSGPARPARDNK